MFPYFLNFFFLHFFSVNVLDVNDEAPVVERLPENCITVTEFHEPGDVITQLKATDADDSSTPNGWINFSFITGNEDGNDDS